jgi:2-oxo-3-hexenedioate decarboxylase
LAGGRGISTSWTCARSASCWRSTAEIKTMAAGAAVLGHPLAAVAMLANHLGARDQQIPAGTFIMTGGVTEAVAVKAGDSVAVRFQDLGTVSMRFV